MITNFLTEYAGSVPNRKSDTPIVFADNVYAYQVWIDTFAKELNLTLGDINDTASTVNEDAKTAEYAKDAAVGSANFKGAYVSGNTYAQGESVEYGGRVFVSKVDNNTDTVDTANWLEIPSVSEYDEKLALKENITDNDAKLASKVDKSGDTMTGSLTIVKDSRNLTLQQKNAGSSAYMETLDETGHRTCLVGKVGDGILGMYAYDSNGVATGRLTVDLNGKAKMNGTPLTKTTDYATATTGGTVKMRVVGDTVYITNDGSDA